MKSKKIRFFLGIAIVIIIIILIILININSKVDDKTENNIGYMSNKDKETSEEETTEEIMSKLKKKTEAERIKSYLGSYFRYVEKKDYNSAYNLLYQDFKNNYFSTVEEYKKYMEEQDWPELLTIDYDTINTQGDLYIVTVRIGNMTARSETQKIEKTFIIKENDYNNYYISFKI